MPPLADEPVMSAVASSVPAVSPPVAQARPASTGVATPSVEAFEADPDAEYEAEYEPGPAVQSSMAEPPPEHFVDAAPEYDEPAEPLSAINAAAAVHAPVSAPYPEPEPFTSPSVAAPAAVPSQQAAPVPSTLPVGTPDNDFWFETVIAMAKAEAISALVRELALQSELVRRAGSAWTLRVGNSSLSQASTRDRLQNALHQAGHAIQLQVEVGEVHDSPAKRLAAAAAARQREAEALIMQDPFVQQMMREFGGKIVPGSIKAI